MKISVNWLRELVDGKFDADALAQKLTMSGFEVEAREKFAPFTGVVVARVVAKRPHPDAAKLTLVDVDAGDGKKTQVVCGATNVPGPGGLVLWARPGASLPGFGTIAEKAVRGIVSPGMLCAEDELGIGTSHAGILILDDNDGLAPGDDVAQKLALPDEIWDLNVTPNRPDCLGHVGVAREVAALLGLTLKTDVSVLGHKIDTNVSLPSVDIELEDTQGCPRLSALALEGVTVGPSPLAVRLRVQSLGVRAISNVVDATNLLLLGFGQPLHAYDHDRLAGGGLIVRSARAGEKIVTLDDQERTLTVEDLVIADDKGPVGVAGVMGGAGSEVAAKTTRLLLEAAHFSPSRVRRTAKRLGLHTEAAHRFERGTDPSLTRLVVERLAGLILKLSGGRVASALTDAYPKPIEPRQIRLRKARSNLVLGLALDGKRQAQLLSSIGLGVVDEGEALAVTVPTFRPDLTREIDLVEEVARLHGYENIPATLPRLDAPPGPMRAADETRNDRARDLLRGLGLDEIVTYGFVAPTQLTRLPHQAGQKVVRLHNPMGEERSIMRTALVPGLTLALGRNLSRGVTDVRAFEVGAVFLPRDGQVLPDERWHAAAILYGRGDAWLKPGAPLDFFDMKGVVEELGRALGHDLEFAPPKTPREWLHPGVQADVHAGAALVGVVGELHAQFARGMGLDLAAGQKALVFEIDLSSLPAPRPMQAVELPRFPSVTRDISFLVAETVLARHIAETIALAKEPLLEEVRVLEEYRDAKLGAGKKSMLWTLRYRAADRTLTDEEVQKAHQSVVDKLRTELAVELR
jgi:phenylalanyl-tRNA synthetase beta chain